MNKPDTTQMSQLNQLLRRLIDAKIDFVVIGEFAGMLHGSSYVACSLEICAVPTPSSIRHLRETLADLNPVHRMTPMNTTLSFLNIPRDGETFDNFYLNTDLGTIDILSNVIGVGDFERLKSTATAMPFQGKTCLVMSLEDLIKAKETLAREKDLLVAKQLRAIAAARNQTPQK